MSGTVPLDKMIHLLLLIRPMMERLYPRSQEVHVHARVCVCVCVCVCMCVRLCLYVGVRLINLG